MTGSTGDTFFHVSHAEAFGQFPGGKDTVMAIAALIQIGMAFMAELGGTGFFDVKGNGNC